MLLWVVWEGVVTISKHRGDGFWNDASYFIACCTGAMERPEKDGFEHEDGLHEKSLSANYRRNSK